MVVQIKAPRIFYRFDNVTTWHVKAYYQYHVVLYQHPLTLLSKVYHMFIYYHSLNDFLCAIDLLWINIAWVFKVLDSNIKVPKDQ
jgi:hypothetical protein